LESLLWLVVFAVVMFIVWKAWQASAPTARPGPAEYLVGDGEFLTEVVGESNYQRALETICGGRCEEGHNKHVVATLVLEDSNRHDSNAVRVDSRAPLWVISRGPLRGRIDASSRRTARHGPP
jgi:hypothetical protein